MVWMLPSQTVKTLSLVREPRPVLFGPPLRRAQAAGAGFLQGLMLWGNSTRRWQRPQLPELRSARNLGPEQCRGVRVVVELAAGETPTVVFGARALISQVQLTR